MAYLGDNEFTQKVHQIAANMPSALHCALVAIEEALVALEVDDPPANVIPLTACRTAPVCSDEGDTAA